MPAWAANVTSSDIFVGFAASISSSASRTVSGYTYATFSSFTPSTFDAFDRVAKVTLGDAGIPGVEQSVLGTRHTEDG